MPSAPAERTIPAPGLQETAQIWWDAEVEPLVEWNASGRCIELVDGADSANRLLLWSSPDPLPDVERVARALADGLAACDFPPTGDGVSRPRAEATLRAAGIDPAS